MLQRRPVDAGADPLAVEKQLVAVDGGKADRTPASRFASEIVAVVGGRWPTIDRQGFCNCRHATEQEKRQRAGGTSGSKSGNYNAHKGSDVRKRVVTRV